MKINKYNIPVDSDDRGSDYGSDNTQVSQGGSYSGGSGGSSTTYAQTAGYADKAGEASRSQHSDFAVEANHAAEADHAQRADSLSDTTALDNKYLSKVNADSAAGLITFLAGLTSNELARFLKGINVTGSSEFNDDVFFNDTAEFYGGIHAESLVSVVDADLGVNKGDVNVDNGDVNVDNGDVIITGTDNKIKAPKGEIDDLTAQKIYVDNLVAKVAHFFELSIDEIKSVGGQIILTDANATVWKVVPYMFDLNRQKQDSYTTEGYKKRPTAPPGFEPPVTEESVRPYYEDPLYPDMNQISRWRVYFRSTDGDKKIRQQFAINDQVVCQTFDVGTGTSYNVSNKFYWCAVTQVSDGTPEDVTRTVDGVTETEACHWIEISVGDAAEGSSAPEIGDKIAQLGNRTNTSRQAAIILAAYNSEFLDSGISAPSIVQYNGINDYNLSTHRMNVISRGLNSFKGQFSIVANGTETDINTAIDNAAAEQWNDNHPYINQTTGTWWVNQQDTGISAQGAQGESITKVSESYRYATNTTGVQPSPTDSSWTTTKPTLQKGAWLFTETTITWSDGSTTTIYSSERNPNDGVAGMSVVITSQSVGYCRRTAAQGPTNNPASLTYSNNYPTNLVKGDWLYTRTVVNYGNDNDEEFGSTISYGVSYIGEDGVQGKGVSNLSEQYGVSADKNTAPTSWSSTMPSDWGKTKPYLWNREVVTYTEGEPSYSEPHIANVWTEDGRGIDSIVDYYCATDKNDYLDFDEDDEWTTTVQAVTATKKYLWNYEEITYTKANEGGVDRESTDPHIIGVYGDKGDTPVITSERSGNTTIISADGHEIATILDGESSHTHVKYSNDLEHFTLDGARREVEFIQNVYRNCGYIRNATMTSKSRVMIDFCLLKVLNTGTTVFIMGASTAYTGTTTSLDKRFNLCYYGGYLYAIIDPSQKESGTTALLGRASNRVRIPYTLGTRIKVDMDFDRVIVNDKDVYYWPEDCDKTEFSTGYALRIFNTNRSGSAAMTGSGAYFARERIYAMKIWQDGVLTNDLVPYISLSTKLCNLYNRVNGEYAYYNTYSDAENLRSSHDVGENRLLNSNFADGLNRWLTNAMGETMTAEVVTDAEKGTCVELMNTDVTTIDATHGIFYSDFDKTRNSYCSTCDDEDALVSFDVKSDVEGAVLEYYARVASTVSKAGEVECNTFWERKYVRIPKQNDWVYGRFGVAPATANAHIRVTNIKIEYGDDYTPWTPAVDDVESWSGKGKYMGVAITNNATAPTDFNAYTWTKVEGDDGKQGVPGSQGPMGADAEVYLFYQGESMLRVDSNRVIRGGIDGYLHHIVGGVDSLVDGVDIDYKLDTEEDWSSLTVVDGYFEGGDSYVDSDAADFDDPHAFLVRYKIDGNVVASASWPIVWDGESQYTADFDDEMLTVPCNDAGVPSVQPSWTTDAHLFKGSDEVDLDINKITVSVPTGITCTYSIVNNALRVVISGMTQTAADSNRILVTFYKESAKTNVLASCYCVLNKMKNGANATMYNLLLSDNALHKKKSDQSIEPSSITVKVTKTDGNVSTDLAYNQWQAEGLVVTCTGGTLTNGVVSNPTQKLKFDLRKNNVLIDAETVPLVEDGANGTSIDIKGSRATRAEIEQIQNPSIGDAYMVSGVSQPDYGHLIVYFGQGDMGSDQSPWEDVGQIKGDNGDNAYFFTAWAKETSSGAIDTTQPILHGSEISADPSKLTEEYTWWGYATNTTNQEPDDYEDFTWQYVKGDKGDKGDGNFTHVKLMSQLLPEGYTRLSYIGYNSYKSNGPVVDTGLRPTNTRGMKMILRHRYSNTSSYSFGARSGSSTSNYVRFAFLRDGSNKFYVGWGKSLFPAIADRPSWPKDTWATCELNFRNSRKWRFNEEEGDLTSTLSGYSSSGYAIRAFGFNQYSHNADVQESIITDGEEVVQHWIAARRESDGLVGMYDIINDNFSGDEDFIAGEDWDGLEMIGIATTTSAEAPKDLDAYEWMEIPEGASGAGISNVTHYYLVNNMATGVTHETTGWSTTPQVTTAQNKYLWEYVEVTFTDGRTPTMTPPTRTGMFAESATLYDIQVMSNTLHINKEKIYDGEVSVEVHKIEGSTDTKLNTTDDGIKVRYHVNTEEDVADWDVVSGGTSGNFYLARYDREDPTDHGGFAKALIIEALDSENHVLRTESVSITEDGGDGAQGESGTSPYIARFDNQMVSIPCDSEGNPLVTVSWTTKAQLWHGSELVEYETVGQFHYNIIQSGLSRSLTPSTDGIGVTVNGLTGTNDFNTVTVYFYETAEEASAAATAYNTSHDAASLQVGALAWCTAIVNRLRRGAQGDNPSVYDIVLSTTAVKVGSNGVCNPSKLYLSVRKTQGTTITQYLVAGNGTSGWTGQGLTLKLLVSVNGGTATEVTTFSTEGTPAKSFYAIPNNTTAITAELYQGNTMIDAQGVSLTKDGESGKNADYYRLMVVTEKAEVVMSSTKSSSGTSYDDVITRTLNIAMTYQIFRIVGDEASAVNASKSATGYWLRFRMSSSNSYTDFNNGNQGGSLPTISLSVTDESVINNNYAVIVELCYGLSNGQPIEVVERRNVLITIASGAMMTVTNNAIIQRVVGSETDIAAFKSKVGDLSATGNKTLVTYIADTYMTNSEFRRQLTEEGTVFDTNLEGRLADYVDTSTFTQTTEKIESKVTSLRSGDGNNVFGKTVYDGSALDTLGRNKWEFAAAVAHTNEILGKYGTPIMDGRFYWQGDANGETYLYSPYFSITGSGTQYYTLKGLLTNYGNSGRIRIDLCKYTGMTAAINDFKTPSSVQRIYPTGSSASGTGNSTVATYPFSSSAGLYRLRFVLIVSNYDDTETYDINGERLQLYVGKNLSLDSFADWNSTESKEYSRILQTANEIELKVKDTGINIDEKKITLSAENTIVNSDLTVKALETMPTEDGAYAMMQGSELGFFGSVATTPNIRIGVDENGSAVIKFYDNSGELRCWLGAYGFQYYSGYHTGEVTGVVSESWQAWGCEELSNQTLTTRKNIIDKFIYGAPGTRVGDTIIYDSQFAPYNGHYFHTSKTPSEQNKFGDPLHGKWYMQRQYVVSRIITRTTPSVDGSEPETVEVKLLSFNVYYFDGGVKTETRTVYYVEDAENKGVYYFATQDGDIIAGSVGWTIAQYLNITL